MTTSASMHDKVADAVRDPVLIIARSGAGKTSADVMTRQRHRELEWLKGPRLGSGTAPTTARTGTEQATQCREDDWEGAWSSVNA